MLLSNRIGAADIRAALTEAESVGARELKGQLNAPVDAGMLGRVDEAWSFIRAGMVNAYRQGQAEVEKIANNVWGSVQEVLNSAGGRMQLVEEALMERLRTYNASLNQSLLRQVSSRIVIGELQLTLDSVEMAQELRVEGSLQASLTELLKITSNGALEVKASYKRPS